MLARAINKKKKRPLVSTDGGDRGGGGGGVAEYYDHGGMPRPISPTMQQQQYAYGAGGTYGGATPPLPSNPPQQQQQSSSRPRPSRISRAFGGGRHDGAEKKERKKSSGGLVRKVFGGGKKKHRGGGGGRVSGNYGKYGGAPSSARGVDQGGVMYSEDDEIEYDEEEVEEEEQEPQVLRSRRRFVRSGLTTYEQVISKTSAARRFNRRSYMPPSSAYPSMTGYVPSPCKSDGAVYYGGKSPMRGDPCMDKENSPSNEDSSSGNGGGMSSLSSALQEVINSRPTALRSVVDPAGPARVQRSFVVEQTADGNLFVASKRVPSGPTPAQLTRQTMDDSFIGYNGQLHDQLMPMGGVGNGAAMGTQYGHHAMTAANPGRHSEMDFAYRQKWNAAGAGPSGPSQGTVAATAASLLSMSKAGVRRRISGADGTPSGPFVPLGGDSISYAPTAMASAAPTTRMRRSSSSSKLAELAVVNQMATMFMDHARQRSRSRSTDGLPLPVMPLRKDSAAMLLQRGSFEDVDALPLTMDDLFERKPLVDKGPMTFDEFITDPKPAPPASPAPAPPPPFLQRKASNGKSGRKKSVSKTNDEDEEVDNALSRSFRNLKDVDALKRSRSLEDPATAHKEENVVPAIPADETETEEEYPDYAEERSTDDLGSSYDDESAVRTSNITDFLGGFKSRTSMNRNSLAGRNSLGRNSGLGKNDFVSRAARSLRNSRKAQQETEMVQSELSRKLWEARARVPLDLRGDPPTAPKKRSGFRSHGKKKSVRFDMARYVREFEVIEPEVCDDEVNQWSQRDSEQDDDDEDEDDDDEDNSTDDDDSRRFGVPIPGAVLAAAMSDANTYYSTAPLTFPNPMRYSAGRVSTDQRYSSVGRPSANVAETDKRMSSHRSQNAKESQVYM